MLTAAPDATWPHRKLLIDSAATERRIRQLGQEIFARAFRAEPGPLNAAWWQRRLLDAVMQDESLKLRMFQFIETLPRLRSPESVAGHMRQYLRNGESASSPLARLVALTTSFSSERSLRARAMAAAADFGSQKMAATFIAGTTPAEAVASVVAMRRRRMAFTMDVLGETVLCRGDADAFAQVYLDLIDGLTDAAPDWAAEPLLDEAPFGPSPRVNVSVKLSAFTSRFDPIAPQSAAEDVRQRLRPILARARQRGAFVNIDMEHFAVRDLTLDLFMDVLGEPQFRDWTDVGIVVQAYLRDSERDLHRLLEWVRRRGAPISVRLVKGAYWDFETAHARALGWPSPVWSEKWESDRQFERLAALMLANTEWIRPAFASHNVRSIAAALAMAEAMKLPPRTLEFQMLYGMGDPLKQALVELGQRVRIYTPFGDLIPGMAYFIRRLLENTANEGFLRQSFSQHLPLHMLLAAPGRDESRAHPSGGVAREARSPDAPLDFAQEPQRDAFAAALDELPRGRAIGPSIAGITSAGRRTEPVPNPSRPSELAGLVDIAANADIERAIRTAQSATKHWSTFGSAHRTQVLRRFVEALRSRRPALTATLVTGLGLTWRQADAEVASGLQALGRLMNGNVDSDVLLRDFEFGEGPTSDGHPIALMASAHRPFELTIQWLGYWLLQGRAVVLAADPIRSLPASFVIEALGECGIDPQVVSFLPVDAEGLPVVAASPHAVPMFLSHFDKFHATQSGQPPRDALRRGWMYRPSRPVVIVDSDTNLDEAVSGTLATSLRFAGQRFDRIASVIVVGAAYEEFLSRIAAVGSELTVGAADDPATQVGPLESAAAVAGARAALRTIRDGKTRGYETPLRSEVTATGGYFAAPTIVADVSPRDPLWSMSVGAPIMALTPAAKFDDALSIAAGRPERCVATLYTRSPDHILRFDERLSDAVRFVNRKTHAGVLDPARPR